MIICIFESSPHTYEPLSRTLTLLVRQQDGLLRACEVEPPGASGEAIVSIHTLPQGVSAQGGKCHHLALLDFFYKKQHIKMVKKISDKYLCVKKLGSFGVRKGILFVYNFALLAVYKPDTPERNHCFGLGRRPPPPRNPGCCLCRRRTSCSPH